MKDEGRFLPVITSILLEIFIMSLMHYSCHVFTSRRLQQNDTCPAVVPSQSSSSVSSSHYCTPRHHGRNNHDTYI